MLRRRLAYALCAALGALASASRAAITTEGQVQLTTGTSIVGTPQGDGVLRVTPPSTLTTGSLLIAQNSGSQIVNGRVFVEGGAMTVQSSLNVGAGGQALLEVSNGGAVDVQSLLIGSSSRSPLNGDGRVVIRDPGSRVRVGSQLVIGEFTYGELVIEGGGSLQPLLPQGQQSAAIGRSLGGNGTVTVDGPASTWQHPGEIVVGMEGSGAMNVTRGGVVVSSSGSLGRSAASVGTGVISGPGSRWSLSKLVVGDNGVGELRVENGGLLDVGGVEQQQAIVLGFQPSSYGRLVVSGANSRWIGGLVVGDRGTGELILEDGVVATGSAILGNTTGSGRAIVRGAGTRWQPASLRIGPTSGPLQSELRIEDGAVVAIPLAQAGMVLSPAGRIVLDQGTLSSASPALQQFTGRGALEGNGDVTMNYANLGGRIVVGAGQRLRFSGNLTNQGPAQPQSNVEVFGGELDVNGFINNSQLSRVLAESATLRARHVDGLANTGLMAFSAGANRVFGRVSNRDSGLISITGGASVTFYDAVRNTSVLSASAGSHVTVLGAFSGRGVAGAGTVSLEGPVQPGASPGLMAFGGDVELGGASRLEIEIAGLMSGTGFDQVKVEGTIELGGALQLTALSGIDAPATLPIVQAGELLGTFSVVPAIGASIGAGVRFNGITYDYNRDEALVSLVAGAAGDFNLDGAVDGGDMLAWQLALGSTVEPGMGADGNCDGVVDAADLAVWNADMTAAAAQNAVQTAVPEPAAWGLALVACLAYRPTGDKRRATTHETAEVTRSPERRCAIRWVRRLCLLRLQARPLTLTSIRQASS